MARLMCCTLGPCSIYTLLWPVHVVRSSLQLQAAAPVQVATASASTLPSLWAVAIADAALQFDSVTSLAETLDEAAIWGLLQSQDLCISENHLLHLVHTWCVRNQPEAFPKMAMHIDYGLLTSEQVRMQA